MTIGHPGGGQASAERRSSGETTGDGVTIAEIEAAAGYKLIAFLAFAWSHTGGGATIEIDLVGGGGLQRSWSGIGRHIGTPQGVFDTADLSSYALLDPADRDRDVQAVRILSGPSGGGQRAGSISALEVRR